MIEPPSEPPATPADRHGARGALAGLVAASTRLHPDDIPAAVAQEARKIGLDDVTILLADLEQRHLLVLRGDAGGGPAALPDDAVSIEGSLAGRAYRTEQPVVGEPVAGRRTVWVPLLDSAERLGVFTASTEAEVDDDLLGTIGAFVSLVGEVVANKAGYGDVVVRTRRVRPLTLAAEMRWSMLPPLTYTGRNLSVSAVLEPAYEIAGDTFDYAVNGDTAHLLILDAVGHGLEAARIANLAVGAYRHGRRADLGLTDVYRSMDEAVGAQFGTEKFATAQFGELRLSTGQLRWVNAGHPAPILLRRLHRVDLESDVCLPLGLSLDRDPSVAETMLEPGDLVLFFTDGVVEARAAGGEEFGRDRLADLLTRAAAAAQTPAETVRRLAHAVLDHQEGVLQDDGSLLLLVWHGPPAPMPFPPPA